MFARGKVLLTGEYAILDGARALALPTKLGQTCKIKQKAGSDIRWRSYNNDGEIWFESKISLFDFRPSKTTDDNISILLTKLLNSAVQLNSEFLSKWYAYNVDTYLDFPNEWGLGSSSTITHLIATWAEVDPMALHFKVFNGSGYDVLCAGIESPITYQLDNDNIHFSEVDFNPSFKDNLYFIPLNKKQSSEAQIAEYKSLKKNRKKLTSKISELTEAMLDCSSLQVFDSILQEHEAIISENIKKTPIQDEFFGDFWGQTKSLGAWGGDMILATSKESEAKTKAYFKEKGLDTIIKFDELF